jgi:Oxysterol-binding protein
MISPAAPVCRLQRAGMARLQASQEDWNVSRSRMTCHCAALQSWKKPFNPLLGETWQAQQAGGGCQIFMEQLSHHPPISAFEMIGPGESVTVQSPIAACSWGYSTWGYSTWWDMQCSCPNKA